MKKRGQVAIFALLGLVLLIIVSFFLMLVNSVSTAELEQQAQESVQEYLESGPINYYVNLCLEQAVQESLIEMGRQGGTFFDSQQGPYVLGDEAKTHILYEQNSEEFNVSYGILRPYDSLPQLHFPELCTGISTNPPDYPIQNSYLTQYSRSNYISNCLDPTLEGAGGGYVGQNVFPRLCFSDSPNTQSINIPGVGLFRGCAGRAVPNVYQNKNLSTEYLLSQRILNKTIECIDFEIFQEIDGHNVTFLENSEKSAQVTYGIEGFTSSIILPFRVQLRGHVPVITSYAFSYGSNVRLAEIQRFIYELLREETMNPNFDMTRDYNNIIIQGIGNLFLDGFEIEIINFTDTDEEYKWDRILKLTDTKSLIFGQNYTYYTAIQNRNPVLDYINPSAHPELNIIVFENDTIVITPNGVDPDNRLLEYDYSRWHQTEKNTILLSGSCEYPFSNVEEIKNCMQTETSTSQFWTNSELFLDTLQSANYTVTIQDIGYHELRVIVRDESGRADFQDVKILVIDLPRLNLEVKNYHEYPEFPDTFSLENPIVFDADKTTMPVLIDGIIKDFEWTLQRGTQLIRTYNTDTLSLTIPDEFNILTIKNDIINTLGMHTMTLKVTFEPEFDHVTDADVTKSIDFDVGQCLPVRSSSPAYPYNTEDPFLSNSTCCDNAVPHRIKEDIYVCYQETLYGLRNSLKEYADNLIDETANDIKTRAGINFDEDRNIVPETPTNINDVFRLDFSRQCDGTRGNICGGDVEYTIQTEQACDFTSGLDYQCSGITEELSETKLECTNFNHEKMFDAVNKDIIDGDYIFVPDLGETVQVALCTNVELPSSRGQDGYDDPHGPLICKGAACDGGGSCEDTRFSECECRDDPVYAECQDDMDSVWEGNTCKYSCETYETCQYEDQTEMPCTKEEYDANGGNSCFNETFFNGMPACYFDLECNVDIQFNPPFSNAEFCDNLGLGFMNLIPKEIHNPHYPLFDSNPTIDIYIDNRSCVHFISSQPKCDYLDKKCNTVETNKEFFVYGVNDGGYPKLDDWECTINGWEPKTS